VLIRLFAHELDIIALRGDCMTLIQPLFSPRLTRVFLELLAKDDFVSVSVLADALSTSKRTLFREISGCNHLLKPYHLELESKSGLGIKIIGDTTAKSHLLAILKDYYTSIDYYDLEQRRMLLTAELLKNKNISKLVTFAQLFDVSEATISNDLSALDAWFKNHNLALIRKPGYGIELEGSEDDVRRAMTDFVHNQLKENKLIDLIYLYQDDFDIEKYFEQHDSSSILNLLNHQILSNVIKVIRNSEFKYFQKMADSSLIGLIIHLTIAIERLTTQEVIQMDRVLLNQLKEDDDYIKAEVLAKSIEKAFAITIPEDEIAFILMHLKGAKLRDLHLDQDSYQSIDDIKLKQLISDMIEEFENIMNVHLIDDDVLHKGLITHLRPALTRMNYKLKIRNPLLDQIKTQYPIIFEASTVAVKALETSITQPVPVDEIGYVALHFGAAIERFNQKLNENMALKIGVVCASGIGISSLLSSRIKNIFPDLQMVVPMAIEDVDDSISNQLDLLITTIPLENTTIDSVYVHPLLSEMDIEAIRLAINACKKKKQDHYSKPVIHSDVDPLESLAQINLMIQRIRKQFAISSINHTLTWNQIIDKVSHLSALDVQQAKDIKFALIDREQYGSVIVEEIGVVLLHAKIENIKEPILKVYVSDKDSFINCHASTCSVIMVMVANKKSSPDTNKMLSAISIGLLEDDDFKKALLVKEHDAIRSALSLLLQKWYRNETMNRLKNI
jgi:mannitol operon transcriptional antiterminator